MLTESQQTLARRLMESLQQTCIDLLRTRPDGATVVAALESLRDNFVLLGWRPLQAANMARLVMNLAARDVTGKDAYPPEELKVIMRLAGNNS